MGNVNLADAFLSLFGMAGGGAEATPPKGTPGIPQ